MTNTSNEFFIDFEKVSNEIKISKEGIEQAKTYLTSIFEKEDIIDWFFSSGPYPKDFLYIPIGIEDTKLDCFILTKKFLINCEFKKNVPLLHMIILSEVGNISEHMVEDRLVVNIRSGFGGIVIIATLKDRNKLEIFVNKIRSIVFNFREVDKK